MTLSPNLNIGAKLAEGSYGNVYSVVLGKGALSVWSTVVYKEYKDYVSPDTTGLSELVGFYDNLAQNERAYLDSICCWPFSLVKDSGRVAGFLMPRIPQKYYCDIHFSAGPKSVEAKFEHLLMPDVLLGRRQIPLDNKTRYQLLLSVVAALNFFHEHDIVIGDFSHSNILFCLSDSSVFFLDCDSFSLGGKTVFAQTETGNWSVAERYPQEQTGTKRSDIYKLGLLALRLLMKSDNPSHYQASTNIDRLPKGIDAGVKTLIVDSLKEAQDRPTLSKWLAGLTVALAGVQAQAEVPLSAKGTKERTPESSVPRRRSADSAQEDERVSFEAWLNNPHPASGQRKDTPKAAPDSFVYIKVDRQSNKQKVSDKQKKAEIKAEIKAEQDDQLGSLGIGARVHAIVLITIVVALLMIAISAFVPK